jgi:serine protease Do
VVGINTAIFSPSGGNVGIAFAIPASTAKQVVEELKKDGTVQRGFLGVQIQPVSTEIAESLGITGTKGALVAEAEADGPAKKAGIVAGDVITAVDGKEVASPKELSRLIGGMTPGKPVEITVLRDGKSKDIKVNLTELPGAQKEAALKQSDSGAPGADTLDSLGLTVSPADDGKGLVVTDVDPDGDAADRGIQAGDVIMTVNSKEVTSTKDVAAAMAEATKAGRKAVLVKVTREDTSRFVALPVAKG